jgi:hypothetical protein
MVVPSPDEHYEFSFGGISLTDYLFSAADVAKIAKCSETVVRGYRQRVQHWRLGKLVAAGRWIYRGVDLIKLRAATVMMEDGLDLFDAAILAEHVAIRAFDLSQLGMGTYRPAVMHALSDSRWHVWHCDLGQPCRHDPSLSLRSIDADPISIDSMRDIRRSVEARALRQASPRSSAPMSSLGS